MSSSWRCPHCGAPQPETARCWVCQRSTTCCATCRHFRRGVASGLGYCGFDKRRTPLHGDEMRACWSGSIGPLLAETRPIATAGAAMERPALGFVPVEALVTRGTDPETPTDERVAAAAVPDEPERSFTLGWTLWGDAFL
jgi:hypothetical protein